MSGVARAASGDWRAESACRGRIDEMEVNRTVGKLKQAQQAGQGKAVCAGCPVMAECGAWLASHVEDPCTWHVVAGLAPSERGHMWSINTGRSGGTNGGRPRGLLECGTEAGWYRHRRWDGMPVTCEPCTEARRDAEMLRKRRRVAGRSDHGTDAAYAWHLRRGETPCDGCKQAHAERNQLRRGASVLGRPLAPVQHGTYTGYTQHYRRDELPCEACREACNDYRRVRAAAKRGAA